MAARAKKTNNVVLTITANGDVGSGKSKAIEHIIASLKRAQKIKYIEGTINDAFRTEVAIIEVCVTDPHTSAR